MRILIISQYYYPERFSLVDIAEELVKRGHKVTVVTGKPNYGLHKIVPEYKKIKYEIINGVEVFRVKIYPRKYSKSSIYLNYLSYYFSAKRFVSSFKQEFDIVLSFSLSPIISIAPAIKYAKKHHVKHLLFCQDLWPESTIVTHAVSYNSLIYKILYIWSKALYKKCDEIIVSSPSFIDYFHNVLNLLDKEFCHINQPILLSKNSDLDPIKYSHKHNFVYAGNIGKIQLTEKLVEAISRINDEDVCLHLMGMGSELDNIVKQIHDLHIQDKVVYHGAFPIEEAEKYYVNADALIVSLKDDGYVGKTIPNKAIQYMKYGKPLIGIIQGDGKDLLSKANGTLFSSEKIEDIEACFRKMCQLKKEEKEKLGSNNLIFFNEHLTSEKIVDKLERELLKNIKN